MWKQSKVSFANSVKKFPKKPGIYGHRDKRFAKFNESPQEMREKLIKLLVALEEMCQGVGAEFWLECGTLLGAFRNQDFIPHDPDADVGMLYNNLVKLQNQKSRNQDFLFEFDPNWRQREPDKKAQVDARIIDTLSGIYVDIFAFSELKKGRYSSKWVGFNGLDIRIGAHPGIFYDHDELFPLSDCTLHGCTFKCPNKTKEHLQKMYGKNLDPPSKYFIIRKLQNVIARIYYHLVLARNRHT
ncbi:LicD family protein [Acidobacteriota bacterium]